MHVAQPDQRVWIKKPLLRTGSRGSGEYREVGWPEALDRVASRLAEIRERYGAGAVINLGGSGACRGALHNTGRLAERFGNRRREEVIYNTIDTFLDSGDRAKAEEHYTLAREHGFKGDEEMLQSILEIDIVLNTKGLISWLHRLKKQGL